ncbi:MAG TPA: hypothetical protein P5572_20500, partial [Phycisphaerae bacterium]|nr:hypothetical protein [Phycisphaerae bacterium]
LRKPSVLDRDSERLTDDVARRFAAEIGAQGFERDGDTLRCTVDDGRASLLAAARVADRLDLPIESVALAEPNLETVFLQLTGRALRD